MNHPTREEWMSYLYDELNPGDRADQMAHLQVCQDCGAKVNEWRAARRQLDAWPLRGRRMGLPTRRATPIFAALKWAAATAIALSIGFSVGRSTSVSTNVERARAAIEPELRQQLRQELTQWLHEELTRTATATVAISGDQAAEMLTDYATGLEAKHAEEGRAIYAALARLILEHDADYVSLKKELDTVALNTDAGLQQTEQQLVQLANAAPSPGQPNSLDK